MLYIILAIIGICVVIWLLKLIGGFILDLIGNIFSIIVAAIYFIIVGPALLCSKIFEGIAKILHVKGFIYYLLSLCSIPSFIYLCAIHIPYSKKERFINAKAYYEKRKEVRNKDIAMTVFITFEGIFLLYLPLLINIDKKPSYFLYIIGGIYVISAFIYSFVNISSFKKTYNSEYIKYIKWREWTQKEVPEISEAEIEEKVLMLSKKIEKNDKNKNHFTDTDIPFGRATAFISYFGKTLEDEEPMYFSPNMSKDENDIREYGLLLTTKGIYITEQDSDRDFYDIEIPFEGIWDIQKEEEEEENCYRFDYGLLYDDEYDSDIYVYQSSTSVKLETIVDFLKEDDFRDISLAMAQEKVYSELDEAIAEYQKSSVDKAQKNFDSKIKVKEISKAAEIAGVVKGIERNADVYANVKNNFDGKQGHGTAAEYANNALDKLNPFNNAEHLGSDNALNGADRIVNGQLIQCKYCETGQRCINEAFANHGKGEFRYEGMQIEVPHDKKIYDDAIKAMRKKIENGQVPGESNPDNAKNYVRRGHVTYLQAYNIAGAGSIESITIDATQGIICSLPGAGVTAIITFATALWNKVEIKEAAKMSAVAGLKVIGKGAAIYTLTMQLSRGKVVNPFYSVLKASGNKSVRKYSTNYVAKGANNIAKKINSSSLAKTKVGKAVQLDKINGRKVIGGTVTAVVVYGPDIGRALQGKISGKQLIKNSTVNTAGLVGAALGAAIPIPVVGSMIGGAVGSFVAKKVMDNFIKDDAVIMFRIMREEFLDIVMLFSFNKEEFDEIVQETIGNSQMSKVLQSMYQSGTPKEYADALINAAVQNVLSKREKITLKSIEEGMELLIEDKVSA